MRALQTALLFTLVLLAPACENGPPWGNGAGPTDDDAPPDFGPTAAYNRRLIFLGPGGELPTSAVFDFIALSDSVGIRRGIRARVVDGARWRALMDVGWEMGPMRAPWRLVPHGPLKLIIAESGELAEVIHRDSMVTRLQLGATLAEHSPDVGTQLVLRSARLIVDDGSVPGILLDAQLGRPVNPELVARDRRIAAGPGTDTAPGLTIEDGAAAPPPGDSTPGASPTPIALPGAEALLLNNGGYYAVIATASDGHLAWIRNAGRDDVRLDTRLEPTTWTTIQPAGIPVPTEWRIVSAEGDVSGRLTAHSTDPIVLGESEEFEALAYVLVTGWIEDRTVRRDVFGLVRHVR